VRHVRKLENQCLSGLRCVKNVYLDGMLILVNALRAQREGEGEGGGEGEGEGMMLECGVGRA
jgi:hypothetical protein